MSIASIVLAAILAVFFLLLGSAKVLATQQMRDRAAHVGFSIGAYRGVGALEVCGAVGLLVGILWWPVGAAAGMGLVLLMIGAAATHLHKRDSVREFAPAVITCLVAFGYLVVSLGATR
ncbi:DoxX family protein [Nocardia sp. NPDC052112]|uniref:DoxX family protein n=1 Tax=Nocardia sp. NPDC052112 TaxID=3155646 RepID=UPI00344A7E9B